MNKTTELAYWINEREAMRRRKETVSAIKLLKKHGWSDDPHMGLVRYCNVHREDDAVTRWLAKNWRPNHHAVWEIVLARMINYTPSLEYLINEDTRPSVWMPHNIGVMLKLRRAKGVKIFTSAYTISTCGQRMDKIDYVMGVVTACREEYGEGKISVGIGTGPLPTLAQAHQDLMRIGGLGSFLAGQVLADLKNTEGHPLSKAPDWGSWSAHGPGSLKGLSEYFNTPVTPSQYHNRIITCYDEVIPRLDKDVLPLHMQDFQNCLCEFSKYERFKRGGHVRNGYTAR